MKLFIIALIGIMFIYAGFSMEEDVEIDECMMITCEFVMDNSVNLTYVEQEQEYSDEWNCVNISNAYMTNNPEWRSFSFYVDCEECKEKNSTIGHALNYRIIDDRFYVHDESWGWEYEFEDWRNMSLHLRDYEEEVPYGNHTFYVNVNEY